MAKKRNASPPIVWRECPHCGKQYDDGNAMAAFHHRHRSCVEGANESEKAT